MRATFKQTGYILLAVFVAWAMDSENWVTARYVIEAKKKKKTDFCEYFIIVPKRDKRI